VLEFQVPEDQLMERLRERARADDTDEVVRNRLTVYRQQTAPLLAHCQDKLIAVDGVGSIDEVFTRALSALGA
jgi:adenylate kinase